MFCISGAEVGIAIRVFITFTSIRLGAWWAGISGVIAGLLTMVGRPHLLVVGSLLAGIASVLSSIFGAAIDGSAYSIFVKEQGCINTHTGVYAGTTVGELSTTECVYRDSHYYNLGSYPYDCACSNGMLTSPRGDHSTAGYHCYFYKGKSLDCSQITTSFTYFLSISLALNIVNAFISLLFSIVSSLLICSCPDANWVLPISLSTSSTNQRQQQELAAILPK